MPSSRSRLARTLLQLRRRELGWAVLAAIGFLIAGVAVGPTKTAGAVCLSFATSALASIAVAAVALEREAFTQEVLALGIQDIFADRYAHFNDADWKALVDDAHSHYRVLGVANHGYRRHEQAEADTKTSIVRAVEDRQVSVEILWLNPEIPFVNAREAEEDRKTRIDTINSIAFFWKIKESLTAGCRERLVLKEHSTLPTCGIHWSDSNVIVTHYLAGKPNLQSPGLVLVGKQDARFGWLRLIFASDDIVPPLTEAYQENYLLVSGKANALTSRRIADLGRLLAELEAGPAGRRPSEADKASALGKES